MDGNDLRKRIIAQKRQKVLEIVYLVCQKEGIKEPKVNFNGCPQEKQDQLAHYHPTENKICISTAQLYKLKSMTSVENTTYHELAHMFEQNHGPKFKQTKIKLKSEVWRPPRGVVFISKEVQQQLAEQRAKLGRAVPEKVKIDKTRCNYHLCRKKTKLTQCKYCKNYFCKEHIQPIVPGGVDIGYDQEGDNYHPCPEYVDFVKEQKDKQIKELDAAWKKSKVARDEVKIKDRRVNYQSFDDSPEAEKRRLVAELDETKAPAARKHIIEEIGRLDIPEKPQEQRAVPHYQPQEINNMEAIREKLGIDISDKSHIKKKTGKDFKLWSPMGFSEKVKKWFSDAYHAKYTKGYAPTSRSYAFSSSSGGSRTRRLELPIKALLIAIAVTVLTLPQLNLIMYGTISLTLKIFTSVLLFTNFLIATILILIYDKLVSKRYLTYQALMGGFLLAVLVSTGLIYNFSTNILINFFAIFLVLLLGFVVGGKLYDVADYENSLNLLNGGTIFLILIWLVYLFANINSNVSWLSALLTSLGTINPTGQNSGVQTPPPSQAVLSACLTNVNSDLQIAEAKLPSGASVNIVNSTIFYYNSNSKTTINNINSWIVEWNSGYSFSGSESCESYYPNLFTCSDLNTLQAEINRTSNLTYGSVVGAGVAVKFQFPPEAQSNGFTEVAPVLCDPSGIMTSSDNYLKDKTPYN